MNIATPNQTGREYSGGDGLPVWDGGATNLIGEPTGGGRPVTRNVPDEMVAHGQVYRILADARGSVRLARGAAAGVVSSAVANAIGLEAKFAEGGAIGLAAGPVSVGVAASTTSRTLPRASAKIRYACP